MKSRARTWNIRLAAGLHERWRTFNRALKRCREDFATRAVHECRVEARRLLSSLDLLQSIVPQAGFRKGRKPVRKCLKLLQPLREVQVQVRLARESRIPSCGLFLAELDRQRRRFRKKALRGIKSLDASRARHLAGKMERDLSGEAVAGIDGTAIRRLLLRRLVGLYRKVILLRKDIDPGNVETIHRARIAFKKLRYTIEPVRELLSEFNAAAMRNMKSLQEALGSLQDTDVYLKWLDKWTRKQPQVARQIALFRHCLLCQRPQHIRTSIEWLDRLPADWQGGPLVFAPEPSSRNRNGFAGPAAQTKSDATPRPARSEAPTRKSPRKARAR